MTYCIGMLLDTGLVMLADSRTHAGVDQISTYRKLTVFERPGDRVLALMSAGNLAVSQAVTSALLERVRAAGDAPNLMTVPVMVEGARLGVGQGIG